MPCTTGGWGMLHALEPWSLTVRAVPAVPAVRSVRTVRTVRRTVTPPPPPLGGGGGRILGIVRTVRPGGGYVQSVQSVQLKCERENIKNL